MPASYKLQERKVRPDSLLLAQYLSPLTPIRAVDGNQGHRQNITPLGLQRVASAHAILNLSEQLVEVKWLPELAVDCRALETLDGFL